MDQIKIGRFIAECRRLQGLTQAQLAEKLNITDRAVSKWENGRSLPDSSLMPLLCDILSISINELFSGERITMDNYTKELEKNLLEMAKQKEDADKRLLTLEWIIGILSLIVLFVPIFIAAYAPIADYLRGILIVSGFVPAIVGFAFAIRIEQTAGYYACRACNYKYVPTYKAVTMAPHMGRTRKMRCPKCGKVTWQKKVVSKDE